MFNRVELCIRAGLIAAFVCPITSPLHAQTLVPRTTERPSFNCTRARAPIELLICADAELAQWDGRLGQAYNKKARQLADDDRKALLQEQRQWSAFRRTECGFPSSLSNPGDAAELKPCVIKLTKERIEVLGGGLASVVQDNASSDEARVVKDGATIAVAQADAEPKNVQGGAGYEAALRALASKLVLQLQSAGQKSATVLDFTDLQGQGTELGRFLAQELSDQLLSSAKTLSLVDRASLQYLLKENKLSMEGLVDPQSTRKLGNLIGIDTVIMGTVTPLGNSVRLSVRAVAVETGKIVASQSTTVPAIGGLGEMYTRGVVNAPENSDSGAAVASKPNIRDRLRVDSFRLVPGELVANSNAFHGSQISFSIENRSGIGVGVAIRAGATSAGPCRAQDSPISGLAVIDDNGIQQVTQSPDPAKLLRWFPPSARVTVSIYLDAYQCPAMLQGVASVPLTVNLVVASGKDVLVLPLNAERVPVRLVRDQ